MKEIPDSMVRCIKSTNLLAFPQSAAKILELAKNPENGPPEYAVPISADPGLTAQILKFANSSFFGFRHKITTIQMALSLICVRTIKNFVLWNAVFSLLPDPRIGPFRLKLIFQDALRRALFCKVFAESMTSIDPEEVFVAGLFQDIAIPVLAQNWPEQYDRMLGQLNAQGGHLSFLEQNTFGWTHADAGAVLVREWGFGNDFVRTVQKHISPDFDRIESEQERFDAVVALSSLLPSSSGNQWTDADDFFAAFHKLAKRGGVKNQNAPPKISKVFDEVDRQYDDLLKITQTPLPPMALSEFHAAYQQSFDEWESGIS